MAATVLVIIVSKQCPEAGSFVLFCFLIFCVSLSEQTILFQKDSSFVILPLLSHSPELGDMTFPKPVTGKRRMAMNPPAWTNQDPQSLGCGS